MKFNKKIKNLESEWFGKNTSSYQEIYVPIDIARRLQLKHDDKIAAEIKSGETLNIFPARIRYRIKKDGNCFRFQVPEDIQKLLSGKPSVKIIKLERPNKIMLQPNEIDLANFLVEPSNIAEWIDNKSIVIWDNMKYPLIVNRFLNALDIAKYLGLYYADGGKVNHYVCCCSTKEIAELALRCYHNVIKNPRYTISILYSKLNNELDEKILNRNLKYWSTLVPISKSNIKLGRYKKTFRKSDKLGMLRIDDSRILALNLHMWILREVLNLGNKNTKILEEFLKGGLLGDGLVSNRRKQAFQFIAMSSNSKEYHVWEDICKKLGLNYNIKKDKHADAVYVRFRDYLNSVILYKNGIFEEYKKRRERLLIGLRNSVETYIALEILKSNFNPITLNGKFGSRTPSFFYSNKGGDLVKNNLLLVKDKKVIPTDKCKEFIKELIKLKILEVD